MVGRSKVLRIVDLFGKDTEFAYIGSEIDQILLDQDYEFPVDRYILQEDSYQNMNLLLKSGAATLVSDSPGLLSSIYENSAGKSSNNDIIFRKNSINNVNSEIERILGEGC